MTDSSEFANDTEPAVEPEIGGEGWSGADIEEAYLKALHAMEDVPWEEGVTADETPTDAQNLESAAAPEPATDATAGQETPADGAVAAADAQSDETPATAVPDAPADAFQASTPPIAAPADGPRLAKGTARPAQDSSEQQLNVSPAQVIEAALFVGGGPLTARKLCGLIRGSFDTDDVERTIDELNAAYLAQGRPYEIRLGEGGYRLELRADYDRLRHRVYGSGPREVRLSQDVLEVLALVAYRQPISEKDIEGHGKQNAGNLLRQLLRRDLVAIERGPGGRKDIQYHTTARFLSVFGLGNLDELPQAEDLAKK